MARSKFIAGNWKMFTSAASGAALARAISKGITDDRIRVAVCPPFPYLASIAEVLRGSKVELGAQNCYPAVEGAYTGEVSPTMLRDVGCRYVIVGHSERRHGLGESDEFINKKLHTAIEAGLDVILCIGETLTDRESGKTFDVLSSQVSAGLKGCAVELVDRLTIAYEPVWAIGTGRTATPAQAQEAHRFIRDEVAKVWGEAADQLLIQYGGSAKPENVKELLSQADVDGALVGGASLKPEQFLAILAATA